MQKYRVSKPVDIPICLAHFRTILGMLDRTCGEGIVILALRDAGIYAGYESEYYIVPIDECVLCIHSLEDNGVK